MKLELYLLFVYISLFITNIYFDFHVYMFSDGRAMISFYTTMTTTTTPKQYLEFSPKTAKLEKKKIKALKTLVWHLSRKPMKEMGFLKK